MNRAANFWYENLLRRTFRTWHAVTTEVLNDFSRQVDGGDYDDDDNDGDFLW